MLAATPFIQLSAQWRAQQLKMLSPVITQQAELSRLLIKASDTKFGRDHDFKSIDSVEDYQARVPLRRYHDFWDEYWKDTFPVLKGATWPYEVPYFALTSGTTTGVTKHVPVSRDMVRSNSSRTAASIASIIGVEAGAAGSGASSGAGWSTGTDALASVDEATVGSGSAADTCGADEAADSSRPAGSAASTDPSSMSGPSARPTSPDSSDSS